MKFFLTLFAGLSILGGFYVSSVDQLWGGLLIAFGISIFGWARRGSLYLLMANGVYRKRGLEGSLVWFRRAYKTKTIDFRTSVTFAYLLLKADRVQESSDVLVKLMSQAARSQKEEKDLYLARSYYAMVQWKEGKPDEAIFILNDLLSRDYKTAALYGTLGAFLLEKGQLTEAMILNQAALAYASDDAVILDNMGQNQYLMDMWNESLETYTRLMDKNPAFPEAWYNYAQVLRHFGRAEEAQEALKTALERPYSGLSLISPDRVQALLKEWGT